LRRLNRIVAALAVAFVAAAIGAVVLPEAAAAKRPPPGPAGGYYPGRTYLGVTVDLSRPYVWLDDGGVWVYEKYDMLMAKMVQLASGVLQIRDWTSGRTIKVLGGWNGSGATQLVFQPDSNLVLYRDNGSVVWATNRFCDVAGGEDSVLSLQNDGNMVVYCTAGLGEPHILRAIWASGT